MLLGSRVKELCKEQGISVALIERAAGIPEKSISKWDVNIPSFDKVERVINTFNSLYGITYDEFMGKESSHKADTKAALAQLKRDNEVFNDYISKKLDEIASDDFDSNEYEILIFNMGKDTYEWIKNSAEYVGESFNLFIMRSAYERAALECDPSPEMAAKKLEEKRAERKASLDNMEREVVNGKTVYISGKTPGAAQTASAVIEIEE